MNHVNEPSSMRPFTLITTIAMAIFVGGSGTLLLHSLLEPAGSPRTVEESTSNAAADPRLAEALIQLARELHDSHSVTAPLSLPASETSQRSVATASGDSALVELAAALRELRDELEHRGAATSPANLPVPTLPPEDQRAWLPQLPSDVKNQDRAYTRQHLFWTEQQVLDRYGLPDAITAFGASVDTWYYQDPDAAKRSFEVKFSQGRVVGIERH